MRRIAMACVCITSLGFAAVGATALLVAPGDAADHLDAPNLTSPGNDGRLDIADLYVFTAPNRARQTVMIMTVSPAVGVFSPDSFHPGADYTFNVDNDGDARQDQTWKFSFGPVRAGGAQRYRLRGPAAVKVAGFVGDVGNVDGARAFAGAADDPFFFDLNAFLGSAGRTFCDGGENDFFAGLDVLALVVQVPTRMLVGDGSNFGVWAATSLGGDQVDRMGIPALNTVFIPKPRKNSYNESQPADDVARFARHFGDLAATLLPDILPFDSAVDAGFLNGRRLRDDVIDIELGVITGDPGAGDCVDANDLPFSDLFPYLAQPHTGVPFLYVADDES